MNKKLKKLNIHIVFTTGVHMENSSPGDKKIIIKNPKDCMANLLSLSMVLLTVL